LKSKLIQKANEKLQLPVTPQGCGIFEQYNGIFDFSQKHPKISADQFNKALNNDLVLCSFFEGCDIDSIDSVINQISKAMPYLIEVFRRPVTHLIELETVVPVDTAKHITAKTVRHLMSHSENWECIKNGRITPKNVLTKTYDDDYGIYENLVFKNLIDRILKLLKKQLHNLSLATRIYNEAVNIDAFSRINHEQYYRAVGLLYSGFFNNFKEAETGGTIRKIKQMLSLLSKYLSHPVYKKNANAKPISKDIKQTNILLMHKDYKHINWLWKELGAGEDECEIDETMQIKGQRAYEKFCEYLMVFAVSNFNFDDENKFNKWTVGIKNKKLGFVDINALELVVKHKRTKVKYLIVPNSYFLGKIRTKTYNTIREKAEDYDKIIFCEPFDIDEGDGVLPISLIDIDSFRYFQKLLLEGMIAADKDRNICAFCGGIMLEGKCKRCRLVVEDVICKCEKKYFVTRLDGVKEYAPFKIINDKCCNL